MLGTPLLVKVDPMRPEPRLLEQAARLIHFGALLIAPTETSYMVTGNALDETVIRKVLAFKNREEGMGLTVVVADEGAAQKLVRWNTTAEALACAFWPGPLTLILPRLEGVPPVLTGFRGSLGLRVSGLPLVRELCRAAGLPLIATSANRSAAEEPYSIEALKSQHHQGMKKIALILDGGLLPGRPPSTLVDLTGEPWKVLREGEIPEEAIRNQLAGKKNSG